MKISSLPNISELAPGRSVRAEVVTSEGGRSLVLLNGVPVSTDGEYPVGKSLDGRLVAADGGFKIIAADNPVGVSIEKMLESAGLHENAPELALAFKRYGVPLTQETLRIAAELLKQLPSPGKIGLNALALMLARKLPAGAASLVSDYIDGKLKFSVLLSAIDRLKLADLRSAWGQGRMFEFLQDLIREGLEGGRSSLPLPGKAIEELAAVMQMQELLSSAPEGLNEGRIYFQWPMFWFGQDLPDTLEGEAFVPDRKDSEQGFSLRLLLQPPSLGHVEVALHELHKNLWVHFAVEPGVEDLVKQIFPAIRERLSDSDFKQLRLTTGRVRLLQNFFCTAEEAQLPHVASGGIDLRV
ncbi:MAG: flagellar hook-length control protein FliK [Erysipelotrichia bacterium]|nr:flagellar hook-length control protein FliK [Erysipelotrichia bacterium]